MSLPVRAVVALLRAYKRWLSPLLPRACRFSPTCSEYGQVALRSHGLLAGSWLTIRRLLRCQPLGRGGIDVPPEPRGRIVTAAELRPAHGDGTHG